MKRNITIKRLAAGLLAFVMIAGIAMSRSMSFESQAKTWTKAEVKKELKAQKKKLKKAKASYKKEKKKLDKEMKECVYVTGATTLSYDPLVIYYAGFLGVDKGYYWIESGQKYYSTLLGTGALKKTGGYKTYDGHTCTVCKGVQVKADPGKYKVQIDKLEVKIRKLENALNNAPGFKEESFAVVLGDTLDASKYTGLNYYEDPYSKFIWSSSDTSIFTVDSKGMITAVGDGEAELIVKTTISGKKNSIKVLVWNDFTLTSQGSTIFRSSGAYPDKWVEYSMTLDKGETATIIVNFSSPLSKPQVTFISDDENIVRVDQNGMITAVSSGETFIRVQTEQCYTDIVVSVREEEPEDED